MAVSARADTTRADRTRVDPITLQIVGNALASLADEMATTICRTAHSTVVRDGMDFSAVVCDAKGRTVAQAVSVPFHLGSIPAAMETLLGTTPIEMGRPGSGPGTSSCSTTRSTAGCTCRTSSSSSPSTSRAS